MTTHVWFMTHLQHADGHNAGESSITEIKYTSYAHSGSCAHATTRSSVCRIEEYAIALTKLNVVANGTI